MHQAALLRGYYDAVVAYSVLDLVLALARCDDSRCRDLHLAMARTSRVVVTGLRLVSSARVHNNERAGFRVPVDVAGAGPGAAFARVRLCRWPRARDVR